MSSYIPRTDEPIPQFGGDRIEHHIKILQHTDRAQLEIDVDNFFETLGNLPNGAPYIREVNSHVNQPQQNADITYTMFIHYVLVV